MSIWIAIAGSCWLCTFLAQPRKPLPGNEVEELVYSRLLGRQQTIRLLAIIMTAMTFFTFVLTLPSQLTLGRGVTQVGQLYCAHSPDRSSVCYTQRADGSWTPDPAEGAGGLLTDMSTGSLNPNASPASEDSPIKPSGG